MSVQLPSILQHANVFHLLGNLFCFYLLRRHWRLFPSAFIIAIIASQLPVILWNWQSLSLYIPTEPTKGLSGVVFATIGILYGKSLLTPHSSLLTFYKPLTFALIGSLIPHIDWCLHTYSLCIGFVIGTIKLKST